MNKRYGAIFWVMLLLGVSLVACSEGGDEGDKTAEDGDEESVADDDDDDDGDDNDDSSDYGCWLSPDEMADPIFLDESTGLMWKNPVLSDGWTYETGLAFCEDLVLEGYDDWRVPTIGELRTLLAGCPATESGGSCGVTDTCTDEARCWTSDCEGCAWKQGPWGEAFDGCYLVEGLMGCPACPTDFTSSSLVDGQDGFVWQIDFLRGRIFKSVFCDRCTALSRCVRTAQ